MRFHRVVPGLLLAAALVAATEYPSSIGYVNDFARQLSESDQNALEARLRAYERSTTNEIAIATVPSLDGQSVEDYARGLFKAWGIGKRGKNNGVLFLWAPTERRVRIQVGYGLESTLTNTVCAGIVRDVTNHFRRQEFTEGVYAAIDGITQQLDRTESEPAPTPYPTQAPPRPDSGSSGMAVGLIAILIGGFSVVAFRLRKATLERDLPGDLEREAERLAQSENQRHEAIRSLEALKQRAPEEVWAHYVVDHLGPYAGELADIRRGLGTDSVWTTQRSLRHWRNRFGDSLKQMTDIRTTEIRFAECESRSRAMLEELPGRCTRLLQSMPKRKSAGRLLDAAETTLARAERAASLTSPNWLLVYDLLDDVTACLDRIENPRHIHRRSKRDRSWAGSVDYSPAWDTMVAMDSSGAGGFDTGGGGGFGGGDCGGGGASGSY